MLKDSQISLKQMSNLIKSHIPICQFVIKKQIPTPLINYSSIRYQDQSFKFLKDSQISLKQMSNLIKSQKPIGQFVRKYQILTPLINYSSIRYQDQSFQMLKDSQISRKQMGNINFIPNLILTIGPKILNTHFAHNFFKHSLLGPKL